MEFAEEFMNIDEEDAGDILENLWVGYETSVDVSLDNVKRYNEELQSILITYMNENKIQKMTVYYEK